MQHLMVVQVGYHAQQLAKQFVNMFFVEEVVWCAAQPLGECLTVNIFHQDGRAIERKVARQLRVLQPVARLKLLAQGLAVADVVGVGWL